MPLYIHVFYVYVTVLFKLVKIRNFLNKIKKIVHLLDGLYSVIKNMNINTYLGKPIQNNTKLAIHVYDDDSHFKRSKICG